MHVLRAWDDGFSTGETNEILLRLATWHLAQVGNPTERERFAGSVAARDYRSLCDLLLDYTNLAPLDRKSVV